MYHYKGCQSVTESCLRQYREWVMVRHVEGDKSRSSNQPSLSDAQQESTNLTVTRKGRVICPVMIQLSGFSYGSA